MSRKTQKMEDVMALKDLLSAERALELEIRNRHREELYWLDVSRTIGLLIQKLRIQRDWSIHDLATASGTDAVTLQRVEFGEWLNALVLYATVKPAAQALGTTLEEIVEACEADMQGLHSFLDKRLQQVRSTDGVL